VCEQLLRKVLQVDSILHSVLNVTTKQCNIIIYSVWVQSLREGVARYFNALCLRDQYNMQVAQCAVMRYIPVHRVILLRVQHCTAVNTVLQLQPYRLSSSLTKRNEETFSTRQRMTAVQGLPCH
jgi:hypothetical protein